MLYEVITKSVQTKIKRMIGTDGKTVVKGSLPIKMTDFGVEPPTRNNFV